MSQQRSEAIGRARRRSGLSISSRNVPSFVNAGIAELAALPETAALRIATPALLLLAGVINLAPLVGVLGAERLRSLYGIEPASAELAILLRHRALLFGVVGGLLVAAVFRSELRVAAIAAGLASMLGFIAIARLEGGARGRLAGVVAADWLGSAALTVAALLEVAAPGNR